MTKMYRLLGPDGEYLSAVKGTLGGNARGRIYGELDCPAARQALARGDTYRKHRVFFADAATAVAAGFRPCGRCRRADYLAWKQGA